MQETGTRFGIQKEEAEGWETRRDPYFPALGFLCMPLEPEAGG